MKIIARGEGGKLFAELTADEFAQLEGYENHYSREQARRGPVIVSTEVDLAGWHNAARFLTFERERLRNARETFANLVAQLDAAIEAVGPPELET